MYAVIAATTGRDFDTETAFTTVAILGMVTHPANMIMTIVPRGVAAFAGFTRIQTFLLRPSLHSYRGEIPMPNRIGAFASVQPKDANAAITVSHLTIGDKVPILEDVNITVRRGSLTVISGPVGCGKSSLLRAILGEIPPIQGRVEMSTKRIAYCAQRPWLPNGSIREVIQGYTGHDDQQWYRQVVETCCLTHDIDCLPNGDDTEIGSKGLNLSGGQRQRVALARAVFARGGIMLLDDTFSALDGKTETQIFDNLLGPEGLLRRSKTTVLLVTNSTHCFPAADHIILLGESRVLEQGPWQSLQGKSAATSKFVPGHISERQNHGVPSADLSKLQAQLRAKDEAEVDLARKTGDIALYGYYFRFVGLANLVLVLALTATYAVFITVPQLWLAAWTGSGARGTAF